MSSDKKSISTILVSILLVVVFLGTAITSLQTNTEPSYLNADLLTAFAHNNTNYSTSFPNLVDGTFELYAYENFTLVGDGNYTPINITTGQFTLTYDDTIPLENVTLRGRYSYYPSSYIENSSSRALMSVMILLIIVVVIYFVKPNTSK